MLRYGVPSYRLPYGQLDKDIDYVFFFVSNIHYDTYVGFSELMERFEAVFFFTSLTESHS
ncbi:hypothetical protein DJ030_15715 [bacterium endosymbiont of Escarpia laminata]|nr:MAG: hypothetical protein DJ030_15715 [bacterium endosymbiont of Escarpia laminata]